jgi:hypothetical protein
MMKDLCAATVLCLWLLFSIGCSSTPSGTISVTDVQKPERLGQDVVVVGMAETKTNMSTFRMFQLFNGQKSVWVELPPSTEMPPQGYKVRVSGTLQQKEYNVIGKVYCIQAKMVKME